MTGNKEKLPKLLQELVVTILSTVNEGLAKKILHPQYERYFRWKLTEYEYGDTGIIKKSAKGEELLKPDWFGAARTISESVSKQSGYNKLLKAISEGYGVDELQYGYYLASLITKIAWNILEGKDKTPTDLSKYTISFLKDLNKEEQEYRAEVHLKGLILQPDSIQVDDNTRLRKPERKDFEREAPMFSLPFGRMPLADPTAFLHVRVSTTQGVRALQNEIDREIAMLRLFRVGTVQYLQYAIDSDSVIDFAGGTLSRGKVLWSDKYLITEEDIKPLKAFWSNMKKIELPILIQAGTGEQKVANELSIAYERYSDSLEVSIIEKRISSAVMGLEALYLAGGEQQEMSYRLRLRVSKLLSLIDYNPNEVSERTQDAYEVRSKYVHGGVLKQKDKQKLERKYGDMNEFSKTIIDYLRASIVALLKRPSKTSLIQKIDDSFLDSGKEEEIRKLLFTS